MARVAQIERRRREVRCGRLSRGKRGLAGGDDGTPYSAPISLERAMKYLAIIAVIVAALVGSQFLFEIYKWNRMQECTSSGGRGCERYGR